MDRSRVVIVHSMRHALMAANAARELRCSIVVRSAWGAAGYAGVGWFMEIAAATKRAHPDVGMESALDCGDDTAIAIEALHAGADWILYHGSGAALGQVQDVAEHLGRRVNGAPETAFDMREADSDPEALRRFLAGENR